MRLRHPFRAVAALGLLWCALFTGAGPAEAAGLVGDEAPDYSARVLGSDEQKALADLRGEVVLFNVWATWCEPCREEMPFFQRLWDQHRTDGLRVVAVSIDEGRGDGGVSRFVEKAGYTYDIWRDPSNRVAKPFRVLGPPATYLIDRDGRVAYHWRGMMSETDENESRIRAALGLERARGVMGGDVSGEDAVAATGLLVAFGAGLISVLSPCVLPLIPSYASVITGVKVGRQRSQEAAVPVMAGGGTALAPDRPAGPTDRAVALRAGLSVVGGVTAVLVALGVLVYAGGAALNDNRVWLTRIGGVFLVVMGLHLLGVFRLRAAEKESRFLNFTGRKGYVGAFLVGVAFAAGWSPCIGPVLSGILTMAAAGGSTLQAAALLLAYSAGLAIPFLLAAMALDRFLNWSARLRRSWLPVAERVSGGLVLAVGVLLVTGIFSDLAGYLAN